MAASGREEPEWWLRGLGQQQFDASLTLKRHVMIIDSMVETIPPARPEPPALSTRELTRCPLCKSGDLPRARFTYLFDGVHYPAVRCASCGLTFLSRQPAAEGLLRLYDADYFKSDYHCGHEDRPYFAAEAEQLSSARVLLEWIEREVDPGRILELGCAGGYFLRAARDRGWFPVGVEISPAAAQFARETLGIEVHTGEIETANLTTASFDAAYLGDVLEHVPDPLTTLRELHRLLRPGGVLLIAGPITLNSLDRRLGLLAFRWLRRIKILRQPPYHLTEFTPSTLSEALHRAGFTLVWLRQTKIPPAWRNPRRRPLLEHAMKLLLDAPNWFVTRLLGRFGDRAIALALRPPVR
jgi:SAM-dependent methyltransferase